MIDPVLREYYDRLIPLKLRIMQLSRDESERACQKRVALGYQLGALEEHIKAMRFLAEDGMTEHKRKI